MRYVLSDVHGEYDLFVKLLKKLNYNVIPIVSENVYSTDTRFGKSTDIVKKIEEILPFLH